MEPEEFDIEFTRGDTCPVSFELTDEEGNSLNLKDAEIYLTVKKNYNTNEFLIQKRYTRKEIVVEDKNANLIFNHTDTAEMKYGNYVYDIQFKSGDYVKTLVLGKFILTKESTFLANE